MVDVPTEGGLLADTGGVMEDDVAVVGDGTRVNTSPILRQPQESQDRRRYPREEQEVQRYREQREELEDLLCFERGPEMVAQEMAQSYAQLLHQPGQEQQQQQQEFISLDELQSRIHQDDRGGQASTILYQQQHQQGSYYSLSAVQE